MGEGEIKHGSGREDSQESKCEDGEEDEEEEKKEQEEKEQGLNS